MYLIWNNSVPYTYRSGTITQEKKLYAVEEFIENRWCKADDSIFDSMRQAEQHCAYLERTRTAEDDLFYRARPYSLMD